MNGTAVRLRSSVVTADRYYLVVVASAAVTTVAAAAVAGAAVAEPMFLMVGAALTLVAPTPVLARRRADSIALTVEEVLLVPAFVLLEPSAVVVAVATSQAVGLAFGWRWSNYRTRSRFFGSRRATFNAAQATLAATAAAYWFSRTASLVDGPDSLGIAAAVGAVVVYSFTSRAIVTGMVALVRQRAFRASFLDDPGAFLTISALMWGVGTLLAVAVLTLPPPTVWLALTAVLVLVVSSLTNRVARQRERLADLLEATARIQAGGPSRADVEDALLESARRLLDCDVATLEERTPGDGELGVEVTRDSWLIVAQPRVSYYPDFDLEDRSLLEGLASMARPSLERSMKMDDLRSADDMKAAVLASVSHDLRTPLATAAGIADLLLLDEELSADEQRVFLSRLKGAVSRVERLVAGLLDLERYELGRLPEPADAELSGVVAHVADHLRVEGRSPIVISGDRARARIDAPALERVLENLLANALRYSPADEDVVVRWESGVDGVHLVVDDAGPGVSAGRQLEIFEPFQHGSTSGGVGLGLWVARRFVELRGGRIWVETSARRGAAFHVVLPAA